jgi:hypothetical protein
MSSKGLYISVNADAALRELKKIEKAFDEITPVVSQLSYDMGYRAVEVAKFMCPVDTGKLRDSIHFIGKYPRITIVANAKSPSNNYPYGISQEYGTSTIRPHPFIEPAVRIAIAEFKEKAKEAILRSITGR